MDGGSVKRARYDQLTGLRGLAAASVVILHFFAVFDPLMLADQVARPWWGTDTPIGAVYCGGLPVSLFFVLSGFVVANSAAKRDLPVWLSPVLRYVRLALPTLCGTLFAWALLRAFPHSIAQLKAIQPHPFLNTTYDGYVPKLMHAVKDGLVNVFTRGRSRFDTVLWTMQVELIGSATLYVFYGLAKPTWRVWLLTTAVLAPLLMPHPAPEFSAFAIGALLREAAVSGKLSNKFISPALLFALLVASMSRSFAARYGIAPWPGEFALGEPHKIWQTMAAACLVYAALGSVRFKGFLNSKIPQFLGSISFGIYLVHVPLALTAFAPLYVTLRGQPAELVLLFALYLMAVVCAGWIYVASVDRHIARVIHWIQRRYKLTYGLKTGAAPAAA